MIKDYGRDYIRAYKQAELDHSTLRQIFTNIYDILSSIFMQFGKAGDNPDTQTFLDEVSSDLSNIRKNIDELYERKKYNVNHVDKNVANKVQELIEYISARIDSLLMNLNQGVENITDFEDKKIMQDMIKEVKKLYFEFKKLNESDESKIPEIIDDSYYDDELVS